MVLIMDMLVDIDLQNKLKIAITGGSGGLGLELSKYFCYSRGAEIASCGQTKNNDFFGMDKKKYHYISLDLTHKNSPEDFINFAFKHLGHIDILINNAVSCQLENILESNRDFLYTEFLINTFVPLELVQRIVEQNKVRKDRPLSIVMINSETSVQPKPSIATYSASKSALLSYARSLAQCLKDTNQSVCTLMLGPLATPYYVQLYKNAAEEGNQNIDAFIQEKMSRTFSSQTTNRLITPEEVGKTILFLHELGKAKNGCVWRLDAGAVPLLL